MKLFFASKNSTIFFVLVTILADQFSKWVLLTRVYVEHQPPLLITDFFSLVMVWNRGVSFGMLNRPDLAVAVPYAIIAVSLIIVGVLGRMAVKTELFQERLGYGLVIGGAIGNIVDRLRFGAVADFFYFHIGALGWPAFNIADSAICVGVFILLIAVLRSSKVRA